MQVNLQPTSDVLERKFADPKRGEFSIRNVLPRLVFRSLSIAIATTLAAMFPFFGDIDAVIGAFGCIPLDITLLMVLYNVTFKSSKLGLMFGINTLIATIFSALGVLGAISSIRQIATIAPPVKGKMFKGMCVYYAVIAFGNQAPPTILTNFMGDGKPLLPSVIQLLHSYAIGCHHCSTSSFPITSYL
ncbi:hypothetical protein NC652_026759 [Populus alba x Populus x berolinensis]|nr:hypothetical protein NC652_026759 [Populus alba x Populus x berolinensis]